MAFELLEIFSRVTPVGVYGFFLLTYLVSQIYFSILEKRKQKKITDLSEEELPFVSIIIPFYNEKKNEIEDSIISFLNLNYPKDKYEILAMDDGSENDENYHYLKDKYKNNIKIFREKNRGKRKAQFALSELRDPKSEYYLTVDSDSVLDPNCIREMAKIAIRTGSQAVTGGILVKKQKQILNKFLRVRYWAANWQERLSQSYFSQVGCCSGPCCLWSVEIFEKVKFDYVTQTFLGQECTYGDDRHLTNLFLRENCKIKMADKAYAWTATPETWKKWVKQQFRWAKSFYRESYWSYKHIKKKVGWFFVYQNSVAYILPFLLVGNMLIHIVIFNASPLTIAFYIASIFFAGLIRGMYAFSCTKDFTYFLTPIYGVIHIILVFPIKIIALFRMKDNGWGTR